MSSQNIQDQQPVTFDVNTQITKRTQSEIQDWLVAYLADILETEQENIDITFPFKRYGLDSSATVGLTGDLEKWLEQQLDPTLLYDYPTIELLAQQLAVPSSETN